METEDGLVVEHLIDQTLVYDRAANEAHLLQGSAAAEFAAAGDDLSRREVLRKLALAGAAAAGTGALVRTIVAPTPADAQTCTNPGTCQVNSNCCPGFGCVAGQGVCFACIASGQPCSPNNVNCCGAANGNLVTCPQAATCP
jgi:hypothetical protein